MRHDFPAPSAYKSATLPLLDTPMLMISRISLRFIGIFQRYYDSLLLIRRDIRYCFSLMIHVSHLGISAPQHIYIIIDAIFFIIGWDG